MCAFGAKQAEFHASLVRLVIDQFRAGGCMDRQGLGEIQGLAKQTRWRFAILVPTREHDQSVVIAVLAKHGPVGMFPHECADSRQHTGSTVLVLLSERLGGMDHNVFPDPILVRAEL